MSRKSENDRDSSTGGSKDWHDFRRNSITCCISSGSMPIGASPPSDVASASAAALFAASTAAFAAAAAAFAASPPCRSSMSCCMSAGSSPMGASPRRHDLNVAISASTDSSGPAAQSVSCPSWASSPADLSSPSSSSYLAQQRPRQRLCGSHSVPIMRTGSKFNHAARTPA